MTPFPQTPGTNVDVVVELVVVVVVSEQSAGGAHRMAMKRPGSSRRGAVHVEQ